MYVDSYSFVCSADKEAHVKIRLRTKNSRRKERDKIVGFICSSGSIVEPYILIT